MPDPIDLEGLVRRLDDGAGNGRILVAIAGPPGAGKSTLAETLCNQINRDAPKSCEVLPMDGYHFDDTYLEPRGWQPRKGAPHTFDVAGFRAMLLRLKTNDEAGIAVPVFDRNIEVARAGARMIDQQVKTIIVEGNYLLLADEPWASLRPFFDLTVMLDVPKDILLERLSKRWADLGYSPEQAKAKIEGNDLRNIDEVITNSIAADYIVYSQA